ncbi:Uncharacterized protein with a C-terminal OMP (outer membrane protein) domain,probable extracellular repeat, HAF family,Autotransporter beta-domain [Chlamydia serpentis]|uniref:Uncharacterized protein with a C-terminal OMP (Outer membrane protein) domain,probable extracellular repeat, HAF family,Autotransporter beta-domain n=1 Tax=Chlamydia serpentis TaxID=1967782 RepID=A0A2R8FBY2_9CHLA|nr:autotransporter domain-containing protein [Chlamydia serpentis]SPN73908.1 Uncharacterized protein with a C-terminal OMP (outer membrane protein) domain,probable extracellular repeat, HAF family,Autotransporter beta-domain [Chlamydia serpentis]
MSLHRELWKSVSHNHLCQWFAWTLVLVVLNCQSFANELIDLNINTEPIIEYVSGDGSIAVGTLRKVGSNPAQYQPFKYDLSTQTLSILNVEVSNESGYAYGISYDGNVIVGTCRIGGAGKYNGAKWAADGTLTPLTGITGGTHTEAHAISKDKQVIVGFSNNTSGEFKAVAWKNGGTTPTQLADLTEGSKASYAYAVSDDGSIIVGTINKATGKSVAVKWENNIATSLGTLGGDASVGLSISGDGKVIVGAANTTTVIDGVQESHAYMYKDGQMTDLGTLGGPNSTATGVSSDGAVIIGSASTAEKLTHAFQYYNGVMLDLGTLGGPNSTANAISADGKVILGRSTIADGSWHAFMCYTVFSSGGLVDLDNTYEALRGNRHQLISLFNLQNMMLQTTSDHECTEFGRNNIAFGAGLYVNALQKIPSNLAAQYVGIVYKIRPEYRLGLFLDRNFSSHVPNNFNMHHNRLWMGAFISWRDFDALGWSLKASFGYGKQKATITREKLENTEAGRGESHFEGVKAQLEGRYTQDLNGGIQFQPFLGLQFVQIKRAEYTENNVNFSVHYDPIKYAAGVAYLGLGSHIAFLPHLNIDTRMGLQQNLASHSDKFSGSITSVSKFAFEELDITNTRAFAAMRINCELPHLQSINLALMVTQQPLKGDMGFSSDLRYSLGF